MFSVLAWTLDKYNAQMAMVDIHCKLSEAIDFSHMWHREKPDSEKNLCSFQMSKRSGQR